MTSATGKLTPRWGSGGSHLPCAFLQRGLGLNHEPLVGLEPTMCLRSFWKGAMLCQEGSGSPAQWGW